MRRRTINLKEEEAKTSLFLEKVPDLSL